MNTRYDPQLLYKVAQMYYIEGKKQEEIAKVVDISRASVSMILSEARERGIVEISLRNPQSNQKELSAALMENFKLKECYIIPTALKQSGMLMKLSAERAVEVFNAQMADGLSVGIAWGRTCFQFMTDFTSNAEYLDVHLYPLIGGSNKAQKRLQLNEMVRIFAEKIPATPHFIHAPALADSPEDYKLYMRSYSLKAITEAWQHMDIAVISVGAPPDRQISKGAEGFPGHDFSDFVKSTAAIGDICGRYFDINGKFIETEIARRTIGIAPDCLSRVGKVICLAAGVEKKLSILGALRTRIIDIFITDETTARSVLSL